ncbi:FtsQ-type POTRA domain-containing protein [Prochlorococcus sp. AH-716-D22]|nr:FtsQ-type POTRA domain-containing protein [Prochlorococcus sp. AH-716-D22]
MKVKQKRERIRFFLVITLLFFTSYLISKTFKKVNYQDISIIGSELFSIDDIVANSSLNFPTPLIFVKTTYTEKELKKNLYLENVSVFRQIFPFGLKILIKTRTPVAYCERIFKGEKITGFVDEDGFFINEKYSDQENLKNISSKVIGWRENFRETLSKILNSQKYNDVEFIKITLSQNGFLTLEEKSLKKIFLGFNHKKIENQLKIIIDMKNQIKGNNFLEKIDNIDLTDPNNPKIKVFKP